MVFRALRLMREWSRRALAGYWTHAGYMNWDSGLGFERWHQAKKLGLTQQALIGMASTPSLLPATPDCCNSTATTTPAPRCSTCSRTRTTSKP